MVALYLKPTFLLCNDTPLCNICRLWAYFGVIRCLMGHACASCPKTQTNSRLARRAVSIVIDPWRAPDLGRVGGDVGDSGSPYAQGKHGPATGCHAPGRRRGSRPGPYLDQNVLAGYAAVALALLILDPSAGLFSDAARPCQRPRRVRKCERSRKLESWRRSRDSRRPADAALDLR